MQSLKNKIFILSILMGGAAFYFNNKKNTEGNPIPVVQEKNEKENTQSFKTASFANESQKDKHEQGIPPAPKSNISLTKIDEDFLSEFKNLSSEEKKSLIRITAIMANAVSPEGNMNKFVDNLSSSKIRPVIMKDSNPYTGTMNVVRTKETLPGTRYIHAQYFSAEDGSDETLQHISFELRPSPDSFAAAKKMLMKQLNITSKPTSQTEKMIVYNVGKWACWIKKLDKKDLQKANPFNSYDPVKDIGTVRVVCDEEIH